MNKLEDKKVIQEKENSFSLFDIYQVMVIIKSTLPQLFFQGKIIEGLPYEDVSKRHVTDGSWPYTRGHDPTLEVGTWND